MPIWKYFWLIPFLPFISGTIFYRRLRISHRFLYYFVVSGVITESLAFYLRAFTDVNNNMPLGHTYIAVSFCLMATFYYYELKGFINKRIIPGIIILFVIFSFITVLVFKNYYEYPSAKGATSALLLVIFSILLFSSIMVEGKIKHLSQSSLIWINTAVLIYYAGNFFYYILFNLILTYSADFINTTMNFFKILHAIFYSLITIGFYKEWKISQKN